MLKKFFKLFTNAEEAVSVIIFMLLVVDIFIGVIWRYVFNNSLAWSDELSRLLFVWLTWLGLSVGEAHNEHIRITMLVDRLPFRAAHVVNALGNILVIVVCIAISWYTYVVASTMSETRYVALKIPLAIGYWSIIVGCVFYVFRLIGRTIKSFKLAIAGESALSIDDIEVPAELAGVMSKEDYIAMLKEQKGGGKG